MDRLFILKYNNYYNRRLKKEESLADYMPFLCYQGPVRGEFLANFKPKDYISTEHEIIWMGEIPDYFIVCDGDTNEIKSRWFVI